MAATLKRHAIQKRRMPCSCCLELFLPVIFIVGLVLAARTSSLTLNPAVNYAMSDAAPRNIGLELVSTLCYNASSSAPADLRSLIPACALNNTALRCDDSLVSSVGLPVAGLCVPKTFAFTAQAIFKDWKEVRRLPTFDQMVLIQWGFKLAAATTLSFGRFGGTTIGKALRNSGKLFWVPDSTTTRSIASYLNNTYTLYKYVHEDTYWNDEALLIGYLRTVSGEGRAWGVIRVEESTATAFSVALSFNKSSLPWTNDIRARFAGGLAQQDYAFFVASGFLTVQQALNQYWATQVAGVSASAFDTDMSMAPMPTSAYKDSAFLTLAGGLTPLVLVLSFLYAVSQLTKRLVEEKELKLREGMFIMGLGKTSFYVGWILTYSLQALISCIIVVILLKRAILKGSDPILIFVVYYLFALSTITLGALLSTFFSKSRVSGIVAPLLYFAMSIPSFALPPGTSPAVLTGLSIFSPSAFAIATKLLFNYELNDGMGWKDVGSSLDEPNMATALIFLALDCVLYMVLTMYFDAVLPSEWGTRKHPLFFLPCCGAKRSSAVTRITDLGQKRGSPIDDMLDGSVKNTLRARGTVEDYPSPPGECSIHIDNIRKEFSDGEKVKVAVDNFQLRLFPNHITALLGHNGAGKSTTINMLTGMLPMTAGDCLVYGTSVSEDLQKARQEIGFCPQHNVLWPNLTCLEHLEYYAALKGVPSSRRRTEALAFLNHVDLADKRDAYSSSLSGGQKRKLSVAIAFIGGSRLILLDEPTAGMDVAARRHTWELLKQMSPGRTIVLTTHFMDEADLLGYRVAIMTKGRLHSYGSAMFLKARLGTGYTLRLSAEKLIADPSVVTALVKQHVPSATLKECKGQEVAYLLPNSASDSFPAVLDDIETTGKTVAGIVGCSMTVSTLEDVFLKIAEEEDGDDWSTRDEAASPTAASPRQESSPARAQEAQKMQEALALCFGPKAPSVNDTSSSFCRQISALIRKRLANARRDKRTIVIQILMPLLCITLAMLLAQAGPPGTPPVTLNIELYNPVKQMISTSYCGAKTQYFSPLFTKDAVVPDMNPWNFSSVLLDTALSHGDTERLVSVICNQPNNFTPTQLPEQTVFFPNASARFSFPIIVNEYYQATVRAATANAAMRMTTRYDPIPFTVREQSNIDSLITLIVGFFIMVPFTFIPSTFVSFIVKERECKAKHQQVVSGVSLTAYWLSNYVFDLLSFLVTEVLAILIFVAFQRDEYIGSPQAVGCVILLFTLYGLSSIAASYAFSFAFSTHSTAQNIVMLLNFICGFVLVITAYVFNIIEDTKAAAQVLVYFFRIIPSYCIGEGILVMAQAPLKSQLGVAVDLFEMDNVGWSLTYMGINFVLFSLITAFLDHPGRARRAQQLLHRRDEKPPAIDNEDIDVARERFAVEGGSRQGDVVTVKHLRKEYPGGKVAVKNLTFGVIKGEVFGFLGTNGAGKTTTMSILASEQMPTNGIATIGNFDVVDETAAARRLIGYCPQFDSLLDLLTVQEHIALYAAIRGIPPALEKRVVDALITACGLEQYRNTKSKSLSGGNKRRLSVAVALVGNPPVVMLDEPSAGMDPVARRELWDVIVHLAKHSSVILTTHHLEEIDVLAHRVGIMVDGEMKCLGSLDHLKRKFGSGFEVCVRSKVEDDAAVNARNTANIKVFVQRSFPSAILAEERQGKLTYNMPHKQTSLARVFQLLLQSKRDPTLAIEDFTVQQTSLEQVFLRISEAAHLDEPSLLDDQGNEETRRTVGHLSFMQEAQPISSPLPRLTPQQQPQPQRASNGRGGLESPLIGGLDVERAPLLERGAMAYRETDPLAKSL